MIALVEQANYLHVPSLRAFQFACTHRLTERMQIPKKLPVRLLLPQSKRTDLQVRTW